MPAHIVNQEKLDLISDYLANHAEKGILTPELISQYREAHKNRAKTGRRRRISLSLLKHKNNPFCSCCDEDFKPWDYVYVFIVSGAIMYHVDHFNEASPSKQLSVIYQDRAYRRKHPHMEKILSD